MEVSTVPFISRPKIYFSTFRCNAQKLDITAFEYTRKFSPYREGFHLDLGQCAAKIVEHPGTTIRRGW